MTRIIGLSNEDFFNLHDSDSFNKNTAISEISKTKIYQVGSADEQATK